MKTMKRLAALLLAICVLVGIPMSVSAKGDDGFTITGTEIDSNGWFRIQFNQKLKSASDYISKLNANVQMGLVWVKEDYDPNDSIENAIAGDPIVAQSVVYNGNVDQIVWKAMDQGVDIYSLLNEIKSGCVLKFYFYDNGCKWNGQGAIGAVQNEAGGSLPCHDRGFETANTSDSTQAQEYLFVDITYNLMLTDAKFFGNNQVLITFNKPITYTTEHFAGLSLFQSASSGSMMAYKLNEDQTAYVFDTVGNITSANGGTFSNGDGVTTWRRAQWSCSIDWRAYNESGRQYLTTLSADVTGADILAITEGSGYDLRFRIQENTNTTGRVDTIQATANGSDYLKASSGGSQDQAWISISGSISGDAMIGTTLYDSLNEALVAAKANGDAVELMSNVAQDMVMIPAGVTLDLMGCTVTTNVFIAFGFVTDGTDGKGKVVMTKEEDESCIQLMSNNPAIPLYDQNGYRFFPYAFEGKQDIDDPSANKDTNVYKMRLIFTNSEAYKLLASNENADLKIGVNMIFTKSNGTIQDLTYNFNQITLEKLNAKNALVLKVSGITKLGSGSLAAMGVLNSKPTELDLCCNMPEMA